MKNVMTYECDLCGAVIEHDCTRTSIPPSWFARMIKQEYYLLCPTCGNEANFVNGFSSYIRDLFKERLNIDLGD
jgi:hypothetical protein